MKEALVLTGAKYAGKDVAAQILCKTLGAAHFPISSPIRNLADQRGLEHSRENLINLGREIAATRGESYLARLALLKGELIVVSGVRQLAQITYIREHTDRSTVLAINADAAIRFERGRNEADNLEDFIATEILENNGEGPQRVFECMKNADITIFNNGTLDEYHIAINDALNQLDY